MSDQLNYFVDSTIPKYITVGVHEKIPQQIIHLLLDIAFLRGQKYLEKGDDQFKADYFQVFDLTITDKKVFIRHFQEHPDMEDAYAFDIGQIIKKKPAPFTQRLYLIENWNGAPKEVAKPDDHYMTLLLPNEY